MSNEYNGKKRSELPDSVFGIPQERKYPMPDEKHTRSAIKLFNHVDPKYEEQLAKAVIKNMKKYGIDGSVVGPNNRLRKYLPEDMIKESTIIPPICSFETEPIHEYKPISGSGILSVIRPISQKDKNDIQHIMNNLDDFEDFMFKNICFYDIERHNQTPIGFVILRKRPELHTAFVSIGVTEEYRDSGIGSKLLEKAISYFKSTKDLIWLEYWVDVNNQASIALAEKSGFTKYLSNNTSRSLGYYKYHMKNDNNLYEQIQESSIEESSNNKIYHLSQINLDGKTIQPTVPSNYITKNGYEDGKTKRVCFATSIDGCLRGLSLKCEGMKLFVHVPDGNYNIYKPSNKEVPDASITGEVWIKKAVKMKCIGQIYVIGDKGEDGIPYKYGDKTAELYDWEWKWIDKFNESYIEESSRSKYSPPYTSEEIKRVYGNKVYKRLSKDPAHKYRMDTGIELIHKEPTKEELERIWKNWNLMSDYQKRESDKKSIELFGMTNQDHYNELINSYTLMEGSTSLSPQNTGISTIIFDIGDVLVSANIKDYLIADPEIPNEIVDELLKLWFIDKDEVDDTMDLDTYREIINKRMGVEFSKYIPKLFRYNVECVTAFDYTIPMIQDLKDKGYKVYYLSNWSAWTYDLLQEAGKFDFLKLMDGGVFSYDVGYMKPNEEIYKILLNKYKINPEEAVFFDDREENIEAANKLGIHGIHFPRHDASIVYDSLKVMQIAHEIFNMSDSFKPCDMPEFITFSPKPALETVCIDIESILGASVTQDDDWSVKVKSYNKRYYDYDTIAQSFMEAAKREDFPISIKNGNDRFEYTPPTKEKSYGEVGGVSMSKGGFTEETIQEYGTTGGTIVGTNQPDSVYIVNYMQNNVFSGHKEKKRAICKKGMNQMYTTQDGHTVPVDIDDFKENASEITVFKLKEQPLIPYDTIIELANFDNEFYTLLTGDIALDVDSILATDSRFVQEENFFDELDAIKACTESTILGESKTTKYPYIKVLTESEYGRPWNYYRDINGVFAMNEITGLRSRSYEDISDIPKPELDLVKRGTVYGITE